MRLRTNSLHAHLRLGPGHEEAVGRKVCQVGERGLVACSRIAAWRLATCCAAAAICLQTSASSGAITEVALEVRPCGAVPCVPASTVKPNSMNGNFKSELLVRQTPVYRRTGADIFRETFPRHSGARRQL
jgi:hypothetical protein